MRRILVVGRNGQVARELAVTLPTLGQVLCAGREEADATQPKQLRALFESYQPDLIINASAYTAVDKAESDPQGARTLNVDAVALLADLAKKSSIPLIHYSTDYVFDGSGARPWNEMDRTHPQGVYALTKRDGEIAIQTSGCAYFIFRTAWVYGHHGTNFYKTMRRLACEREELKVVHDQIGSPTWSAMIALGTAQIISQSIGNGSLLDFVREHCGIYHMSAAESCSWYEFAREILENDPLKKMHRCQRVIPISTSEYPTPAKRPANSVLDNSKLSKTFGVSLPDWKHQFTLVQMQLQNMMR